jgi:hypothetical protein
LTVTTTGNGKTDTALGEALTNDAAPHLLAPFIVEATLEGTCAILFHRWSCEDVEAKSKAAKNSAAKKTDNVDAYVYRVQGGEDDGHIGVPGEYVRQSIIHAAKFRQDPRSPRKSAMDLYKAAVVPLTEVASLGTREWDYLDKRRVTVQRNGVTRVRPAFLAGWKATFQMQVVLPEYVSAPDLLDVLSMAGRVVGLADNRPSYGRFQVVRYEQVATV